MKTYYGSCHCGAVCFQADIDLAAGTNKCNCPICVKSRNWNAIIKPNAFQLTSEDNPQTDYQYGSKRMHHYFCTICGVRCFARGHAEEIGGDYVAAQLASLDNAEPEELISAPIRYANGNDDDWDHPPKEVRHL